jgi:hypothetical protein
MGWPDVQSFSVIIAFKLIAGLWVHRRDGYQYSYTPRPISIHLIAFLDGFETQGIYNMV